MLFRNIFDIQLLLKKRDISNQHLFNRRKMTNTIFPHLQKTMPKNRNLEN